MPHILILNDTRDQPNWGSQACAQALADIICARVPGAVVDSLPAGLMLREYRQLPEWLGGRTVPARNSRWLNRLARHPFIYTPRVADEFESLARQWLAGRGGPTANAFLQRLPHTDAVVFNAEGSTYRVNHCAKLGLFMLWFARVRANIPALFLNGTVNLTDVDRILPGMARKTFRVLDGVAVREPKSLRNVQQYLPGVQARMVPDSVFYFRPPDVNASPAAAAMRARLGGEPYFCLSASMLPIDYFRSGRQASAVVALIRALKQLVPQAVLAGKDDGDQWLRDVAAVTDSHFFGPENSYDDLMALLSGAQFLVSGRYHNIILASVVGCPSLALTTTSHKIDGLCELMEGVLGRPFDATDLWSQINAMVAQAQAYLNEGPALRERVKQLADRHRQCTLAMGDMVQLAIQQHQAMGVPDTVQLRD